MFLLSCSLVLDTEPKCVQKNMDQLSGTDKDLSSHTLPPKTSVDGLFYDNGVIADAIPVVSRLKDTTRQQLSTDETETRSMRLLDAS